MGTCRGHPPTCGEHEGGGRARTVSPAASLVYRLPQSWVGPKLPWKIAHASLHLLAFLLTVLGLVAVFRYHNSRRIANLYSLHSWLGITTVFFFACQVGAPCPPLAPTAGWHRGLWLGFSCLGTKYSLCSWPGGGLCRHPLSMDI